MEHQTSYVQKIIHLIYKSCSSAMDPMNKGSKYYNNDLLFSIYTL